MDIAVLGSNEFVLGFRLGGVKRVYTVKPENYEQKLLELIADSTIGVLAIDSNDTEMLSPMAGRRRQNRSLRSWSWWARKKAT